MRKIITILFALMLVVSMSVPAFAVTPRLNIPNMPEIPDISDDVKFELPDNFWDNWFKNHPIIIDWSKINLP